MDLDPICGVDQSCCFPMFSQKTAANLNPKLCRIFSYCCVVVSFLLNWRIPKGPISALASNFRSILITPVLSQFFERLILACLVCFLKRSGDLPSHKYSYYKNLGTVMLL